MKHSLEAIQSGLQIFEDDIPVDDMPGSQMTVLRRMQMVGNHFTIHDPGPLKTYLEEADLTLERAAKLCEARVPQHTWGLRRVDDDYTPYTPQGYGLFAEIEVIDDPKPITDQNRIDFITGKLHEHKYDDDQSPARWGSASAECFADGYARLSRYAGTLVTRIDPIMLLRPKTALASIKKRP